MAFSIQEIENSFKENALRHHNSSLEFLRHSNYPGILDYLTGRTNNLSGIVDDPFNFHLSALVPLIKTPEEPTENDRLILDVIFHPDIIQSVQYWFFSWLVEHLVSNNNEKAIQGGVKLFKRANYSEPEMILTILNGMNHLDEADQAFHQLNSPLRSLLKNHLPKQILINQNYPQVWNNYYFRLLEEVRPHLIEQYIALSLERDVTDTITALAEYKEGKYIPLITDWIKSQSSTESEVISKFRAAVSFHEILGARYRDVIIQSSRKYLDHFRNYINKNTWEGWIHFDNSDKTKSYSLTYGGVAVHYLLQDEPDYVQDLIQGWFQNKAFVSFDMLRMLHAHLGKKALPFLKLGLLTDSSVGTTVYWINILDLLEKEFEPSDYLDAVWDLVSSKSKSLRHQITRIVVEQDAEAENKAEALLANKNAEIRQTAALILSQFTSEKSIKAVTQLLETESNDNTRDIYLHILKDQLPKKADLNLIKQLVDSAIKRKKLTKPLESWLNEADLPPLFFTSGEQLTIEEVRFLLYRMSRVSGMRSEIEANYLIQRLDKQKAASFAEHILKLYSDKGTLPDQKYLLALAALMGDSGVVDQIRLMIDKWIEGNRLKMAEHGVGALALQGSDKALRWVEWYSRKYKNKKANVGAAALQALEDAAEELNISIHELGDRVVPDFGFNGLYKEFQINGEEHRAFIDSNFKLCFFNEDNKKLKSLPASAKADLKEEFKMIGKEVRDVVKSQSGRLEYYLVIQRKWEPAAWKDFFLNNPVMFIYANKLLWGAYDGEGDLLHCFRCLEDTSLVNLKDDEIELAEDQKIGIVHPLHLGGDQLQKWKRKFFDDSIESIFPQLDRNVQALKEEDRDKTIMHEFVGKEAESGAIKTTLERFGWRKEGAADGGFIDSFYMQDNTGIKATLEVEGVFVGGFGYDQEPKLGRLYFIDRKKETAKWFNRPSDEKDERLIPLKNLSPIFYSEVIGNILSIRMKKLEAGMAI